MAEPTPSRLAGDAPGALLRRYFLATRPGFFTASLLPVLIGTALGAVPAGQLDVWAALLALLAIVSVHAGINVLNDVFDDLSGNDRANDGRMHPYTGGSRVIQNGVLTTRAMARFGVGLLVAGVLAGVFLAWVKGPVVLVLGLGGILLGVLYSMPPVWLSARGLGEVAVAIGFGVLPVVGAAWLQGRAVDAGLFAASLPVGFWIANVLLVNEVPDAPADAAVGRRTLAVRLGRRGTAFLYGVLGAAAVPATLAAAMAGVWPAWAVAGPVGLLLLVRLAVRGILSGERAALKRGIESTLAVHGIGGLWLLAVVLSPLI